MEKLATDRYPLAFRLYPYAKSSDQTAPVPVRHTVVVAGGGPVGLATALDLGRRGIPVLVLDDQEGAGLGSRAICFAKRTLEICDRLGAGEAMLAKGVQWNVGKVFHDDRQLYEFNLLPESGHAFPAFINLQQPLFEKFLHEAIVRAQEEGAPIEIRGRNRVDAIKRHGNFVTIDVTTPDGPYQIEADWLVACDGARSPIRSMLDLGFEGRVFEDNFLIADVKMKADFPTERWFWFEPHFKSGDSALLHKQPDDIWRIDFQLGWNIDRQTELQPENIRARVSAMLGPDVDYELEWCSIYTFQCRRMDRFRHGPVLFAGDSAHQVSPFGARGANSGIQDADNLGWKLALLVKGLAGDALLDTYDQERVHGADENIVNSTRATDFITPKSAISKLFRNAVLSLAEAAPFARTIVNSGRLSLPCTYDGSRLNGPDATGLPARTRPGSPCPDAPVDNGWLLARVGGDFTLLAVDAEVPATFSAHGIALKILSYTAAENDALCARYLGSAGRAVYLIRPDQHVCARFDTFDPRAVAAALARALAKD
ncbi:FAD-dependent oxidoreductase [Rhizobium ruizarguesonis]|jgi:3-(3-hydroxy-phenyl)propionate hydroxylase|uniref:FAD-dependent oxidoreductase n=4 Tax=Rhizobium TaxID=379 RepID=A0AAE8TY59_9HYPH|nr:MULTISPECIES: FAD-dependent oxidoreductase [Rhizobium]NEJ21435.1 FAD-dependent oxidoreductase [Rhizobium leguminosarum]MCB2402836.1 FAD-dependent oxidoreductase [Rhizobium ruizarguesonis]NEH28772.1 FAD-dependent oxidoreductase [Rhizobium ruizarguesonis]NEH37640.1 FAD-dependent oxidoreductase [Rhizobium ruizarguesonis]NEH62550.1 FAD-dependent oxidoreductase [Rhizobium ruizarguesonis]